MPRTRVSITSLLVEDMGLPQANFKAARESIHKFLTGRLNIHYAVDAAITEVARLYMTTEATKHFSEQAAPKLKYNWSIPEERAKIQNVIRQVMTQQQVYALRAIHEGFGDCPGCRDHPPPPSKTTTPSPKAPINTPRRSLLASPSTQNQLVARVVSPELGSAIHQPLTSRTKITPDAGNEDDSDPNYTDTPASASSNWRPRKRLRRSTTMITASFDGRDESPELGSLGDAEDTISVKRRTQVTAYVPQTALTLTTVRPSVDTDRVSMIFRGEERHFRSVEHQIETLAILASWQAKEMRRMLKESSKSRVEYHQRAYEYEKALEEAFVDNDIESPES